MTMIRKHCVIKKGIKGNDMSEFSEYRDPMTMDHRDAEDMRVAAAFLETLIGSIERLDRHLGVGAANDLGDESRIFTLEEAVDVSGMITTVDGGNDDADADIISQRLGLLCEEGLLEDLGDERYMVTTKGFRSLD